MTVEQAAPAKINLTLHVTGRREDGYHLLDSLVTFAKAGDVIRVMPAAETSLEITGPFAEEVPLGPENLVRRAAELMGVTAAITLDKRLPVASGLGGGSADAAATLLALAEMSGCPLPSAEETLSLGADVPVCLRGGLVRMRGIGEALETLGPCPDLPMVLVNPRVPISTTGVFGRLASRQNSAMSGDIPAPAHPGFLAYLAMCRNDLEAAAIAHAPVVGEVLATLRSQPDCQLARMSGSGASCFAIFADDAAAARAAARIGSDRPNWWVTIA